MDKNERPKGFLTALLAHNKGVSSFEPQITKVNTGGDMEPSNKLEVPEIVSEITIPHAPPAPKL